MNDLLIQGSSLSLKMGREDVAWSMYTYIYMNIIYAGVHGSQDRKLDCLELESQVVVNGPMWVFETGFGSSGRVVSTLSLWAISPDSSHDALVQVQSLV